MNWVATEMLNVRRFKMKIEQKWYSDGKLIDTAIQYTEQCTDSLIEELISETEKESRQEEWCLSIYDNDKLIFEKTNYHD